MIERADIQGNLLVPYDFPAAAHVFFRVRSAEAARAWIGDAAAGVTTAEPWTTAKPSVATNLMLSASGLRALGVPERVVGSFPGPFGAGMAARAEALSDPHPDGWELASPDVLVQLNAREEAGLDRALDELTRSVRGMDPVLVQHSHRLPHRGEHFGFVDGLAQPAIEGGADRPPAVGNPGRFGRWHPLPTGELIHGYPDLDARHPPAPPPPFARNGTFLVWRKLEQDVVGFRRWMAEQAASLGLQEELVAAKLMGRWRDGTPLVRSPDRPDPATAADESFRFSGDPRGLACPLGAHIRRANPRDALGFESALTGRHRMVRRGMPYGGVLPPDAVDDGAPRGLVFVACVADIARQFEFIQTQWLNDGNPFGLGIDRDPIAGQGPGSSKMTLPGTPPRFVHPLPAFVTMRGGEYFYVPGLGALRAVARGRW